MYEINGDFGEVRLIRHIASPKAIQTLNQVTNVGWHKCNSKYRIKVEEGCSDYMLFFTVGGLGTLHLNEKKYALTANTIAIIPPNAPLEYYTPENQLWEFYWIHIDGAFVSAFLKSMILEHGTIVPYETMKGFIDDLEDLLFLKKTEHPDFELRASFIVSKILHQMEQTKQNSRSKTTKKDTVDKIIRYIETHYREKLNIEEMSRNLFMSKTHLIRVFKAQTDYTPYEYLQMHRILKAKDLLLYSNLSVSEIAQEVGFLSPSNFISTFKSIKQETPNKYRAMKRF